eukprot:CAMPEP_0198332402 /NCGR_PEP_ID=MMETSP1450-20131203/18255_1 /TAXON_ID=753684 ORGANISM="Madagascaria erythrocladiodes, Strain CCMP3234" /NCGR_SAMPLE_ID=MMETSP1450 /ASSEMBLY_ACC=CAM_ASM_001115 /LENGTH=434 /DNA_ID=CAMNT_0044036853 /DNA_START=296 /DNA_END=1600 /DNA_ORIENTATION=+
MTDDPFEPSLEPTESVDPPLPTDAPILPTAAPSVAPSATPEPSTEPVTPTPSPTDGVGPVSCSLAVAVFGGDEVEWDLTDSSQNVIVASANTGGSLNDSVEIESGKSYLFRIKDPEAAEAFDAFVEDTDSPTLIRSTYSVSLNANLLGDGVLFAEEFIEFEAQADCSVTLELPTERFKIRFIHDHSSDELERLVEQAAARWDEVIAGGVPPKQFTLRGERISVNDLLVDVQIVDDDGVGGTLAYAISPGFRGQSNQYKPYFALVGVDRSDLEDAFISGNELELYDTLLHELGHTLGLASFSWLLNDLASGPEYFGSNAVREFHRLLDEGGLPFTGCTNCVPLESSGGDGTAGSHWSEDIFGTELMTGFADPVSDPLSRLTIGGLEDLGYDVDYSNADPFALSASRAQGHRRPTRSNNRDLWEDLAEQTRKLKLN